MLRLCTVTPAGSAALTVSANAHAANQRSSACRHAAGCARDRLGYLARREFLVSVEHLYARHQATAVQFRQVLANQQCANSVHSLFALALNCLKQPQLDLALFAYVWRNCKFLPILLDPDRTAFEFGYVGPVTTLESDTELHHSPRVSMRRLAVSPNNHDEP